MRFLSDILVEAGLVVDGVAQFNTVANASVDTDKFLVIDGGVLKYRTGAQMLSDIGANNGTVTSVAMTVPTGLQIGGSPITTSGTLALTFQSGYSIPTNVKQSNWDDAYTWVSAFPTQTGNGGKYLTTDGNTLSWATVTAGISGSGTTNYLPKWTGSTALGNSLVFDDGTNVGIGTATPSFKLDVTGSARITDNTGLSPVLQLVANLTTGLTVFRIQNTSASGGSGMRLLNESGAIKSQIFHGNTSYSLGGDRTFVDALGTGGLELTARSGNLDLNTSSIGSSNAKLRLFNNGNVGIASNPVDAGFKLDVSGTFRSTLDANINGLTVGKGGGQILTNTAIGYEAILNATTGGINNIAQGYQALRTNTTGNNNTALGYVALYTNSVGIRNTAVGSFALQGLNSDNNTGVGFQNLLDVTSGQGNTAIGSNTGRGITTGSFNTIIGASVTGLSSSLSNTIILADGQGNQRLYINSSGNVGIGSTNPTSKLVLNQTSTGEQKLSFQYLNTEYGYFSVNTASGVVALGSASYGSQYFGTYHRFNNNLQLNSATATGNTPALNFTLVGTSYGTMYVNWDSPSLNIESASNTAYSMRFSTGGSERMRIFGATGNISVNSTTDAGYRLNVSGTTQTTALRIVNGDVICDNTYISNAFVLQGSTNLWFYNNSSRQIRSNGTDITVFTTVPQLNTQTTFVVNDAGSAPSGYKIQKWMTGSVEKAYLEKDGNLAVLTSGLFGSIGSVNASAVLQADSTTKGFLPPRMTATQRAAITTPAVGLVVYQTDGSEGLYENTSTGWRIVNAAGGGSGVTGTGTTNYLSKWTSSTDLGNSLLSDISNVLTYESSGANAGLVVKSPSGYYYPSITLTSNGTSNVVITGYLTSMYAEATGGIRLNGNGTGNVMIGTNTDSGYKLDVNGTARINSVIFSSNASQRIIEYNNASGLTLQNTAGPLYMNATMTINRAGDVQIYNNFAALRYISFSGSYRINTNDGYSNQFGLNIGADGTRVMQIFNGGNVAFEKGVDYTSTNTASALVAINSTTQGFLPPRMTETQKNAISSPATGLIIYQTDGSAGFYFYNGSAWKALAIVS